MRFKNGVAHWSVKVVNTGDGVSDQELMLTHCPSSALAEGTRSHITNIKNIKLQNPKKYY